MQIGFRAATTAAVLSAGLLGLVRSAEAVVITPAVEYTSTGTEEDGRAYTTGYSFSLSSAVDVNALGYWAGNTVHPNLQVGIWNSSGSLIVSTTVTFSDPVVDNFVWNPVSAILPAGTYTIGAEFFGGLFPTFATGLATIPGYTWITDEQSFGSGLHHPTSSTRGSYGNNGILWADFSVAAEATPLPAALPLFATGLGGLGLLGWRRKRRAQAVA